MQDKPTEKGLYWARKTYSDEWDHVVKIQGEKPFFTYIAWSLKYPLQDATNIKIDGTSILTGTDPTIFIFGDEIKQDYVYHQTIRSPEQCGLYWAVAKRGIDDSVDSMIEEAVQHIYFDLPVKPLSNIRDKYDVLVYIRGRTPYMSCFTFDVLTGIKTRAVRVSCLSFLKRIDEPLALISK